MKTLLSFALIFVFVLVGFGQTKNQAKTDSALIDELQTAQNNLYGCYEQFWKDTSEDKSKNLNNCRESKISDLSKLYEEISKRPDALKFLLGKELSQRYSDSTARLKGAGQSKTESALDSQIELQRIIVIQNQRIIELLEKLLNKK